ncbi:MAG: adenylate/guanylate cyclase domain-containing protein [Hyphomicrobiales bacterium]|nr:adenylate/guanylate cyclase domain-containing protein [Hyphomicrobiales bacterium]MCP5372820.1 adenylate/guanylate cyclase domain-containing protein [Hyphomicrobiales bacterium]
MSQVSARRRLAAVLAADIAGYSRLMDADEDATMTLWRAFRAEVIDPQITAHGGRIVKHTGDGFLAEFQTVLAAVSCAWTTQVELARRNADLPPERRMEFRMGINLGDVLAEDDDIYGDGVNIAARLEALADPGGICLSGDVYNQVHKRVDYPIADMGEQRVKNISTPVRAYKVLVGSGGGSPAAAPPHGRRHSALVAAAVAAVVLVTGGGAWWYAGYGMRAETPTPPVAAPAPPAAVAPPSIAVLPFDNMSGDPGQEYFSDGMTEDLITDLSKVRGLTVIARSSTFSYKGKPTDIRTIGRELDARYVVEGSVRRVGDQVRINVQLIDAGTGHHVWAERYDGTLKDIFRLQDRIGRQIVSSLSLRLGPGDGGGRTGGGTENLEAYDLFLRGRDLFERFSRQNTYESRAFFEKAIALDPDYAEAYAMLAWTHVFEFTNGWNGDSEAPLQKALELANRAIGLNADMPVAYFARGLVYRERRQYVQALADAQKSIEIDPSYANGHVLVATLLYYAGRPEQGLEMVMKAQRLHPHHPSNYPFHEGQALFILKRYDEAIAAFTRGLKQNNTSQRLRVWLAATYAQVGRQEDAEWEADMVLMSDPNFTLTGLRQAFPFTDPAELEHILGALRKAGFKGEI